MTPITHDFHAAAYRGLEVLIECHACLVELELAPGEEMSEAMIFEPCPCRE